MKITAVEVLQYSYSIDEAMKSNLKKVPD